MAGKTDMTDVFEAALERNRMAGGCDIGGGNEPPDIAESPRAERRPAPVRKRHQPVRRRRKAVHEIVLGHVFSLCPGFPRSSAIRTILSES
jgi:hypothetical protein